MMSNSATASVVSSSSAVSQSQRACYQPHRSSTIYNNTSTSSSQRKQTSPPVPVAAEPQQQTTAVKHEVIVDDDDDDDDDFMFRIVHQSCQGSGMNPCHIPISCHLEDQLDLLTHCRQPLAFLTFFQHHHGSENNGNENDNTNKIEGGSSLPLAGAYVMANTECEYCGSQHTKDCDSSSSSTNNNNKCRRPNLFFQKKRPPFEPPDKNKWDPETDAYIAPTSPESPLQATAASPSLASSLSPSPQPLSLDGGTSNNSWVSGFMLFGGGGGKQQQAQPPE